MYRTIALFAASLSVSGSNPAAAEEAVLNLYAWADYFPEPVIAAFQQNTGIKVNYDIFDSNATLETKLTAGSSGYDVVVPNASPHLARQVPIGVYQALDKARLTNYAGLDPGLLNTLAAADPGNRFSVPWMWGSTGLGYDRGAVLERIPSVNLDSLALLFDPENARKLADCGINVVDSANEVIPAALLYLDKPAYSMDPADLEAAKEVLMKIRPYIKTIATSGYPDQLADGDLCLAFGYSGDVFNAAARAKEAERNVDIRYSVPREGVIAWIDTLAIPADAPHPDSAYAFIDFMLAPENAAAATNLVNYANASAAATPLVKPEIRNNAGIYPPEDVRLRLTLSPELAPEHERALNKIWSDFRNGAS
jgi:putrescine transport system substrate-binding protein